MGIIICFIHRKFVNLLIRLKSLKNKKVRPCRTVEKIKLYYRICDKGRPKNKPEYITKEKCIANAINAFPIDKVEWKVIADNISEETYLMLLKYIPSSQIERVSIGSGAGTFRLAYEDAIKGKDNDFVYFLEDDYLHLDESLAVLINAAKSNFADYYTLYDHPDKYGYDSENPFVKSGGEDSCVFWCGNHHWKYTNSTTMTFAAFVDSLKRDKNIFWCWTDKYLPMDFNIFSDLSFSKKAKLISPIPSMSTHGENDYLAKGIDWSKL